MTSCDDWLLHSFRGQGTRHASFHLQRDSLQRYKSLDRKSVSFRHPSFRMPAGHRRSFDENAPQGMPHTGPCFVNQEPPQITFKVFRAPYETGEMHV